MSISYKKIRHESLVRSELSDFLNIFHYGEETKVKRNKVEVFLAVAVIAIIVFFTGKISILIERTIVSGCCSIILWNTIVINKKFELLKNSK